MREGVEGGGRSKALFIFHLDTARKRVVSFKPRPFTHGEKNPRFGMYAYVKRKIPFLYGESKDESSADLPVVYSLFYLSYPGSEETGKYKTYEIKGVITSKFLCSFSLWILLPSSVFSKFKPQKHIHIQVCLRYTTFYSGQINKDKWAIY